MTSAKPGEDPADTGKRASGAARMGMLAGFTCCAVWWTLAGPAMPERLLLLAIPMGIATAFLLLAAFS